MSVPCSIFECEKPSVGRGWCTMHYKRWKIHGSPLRGGRNPITRIELAEYIWTKFERTPDGCWRWTGTLFPNGYGAAWWAGTRIAHRLVYQSLVGPVPDGLQLDHLCRNRACVNPSHLEPVTPAENIRRGVSQPAANARKTHCPQGHPLSGANLYVSPDGERSCRKCRKEAAYRWLSRQS